MVYGITILQDKFHHRHHHEVLLELSEEQCIMATLPHVKK
jgi:hypothetical protein